MNIGMETRVEGAVRREPLTIERITAAALEIVDRDGLDALSMRQLAAALGVSPMALYNHVPNKERLLDRLCEELFSEIDLSGGEASDVFEEVRTGMRSFRQLLLRHPSAITLMQTHRDLSPACLAPVEYSISLMRRAGLDPEEAVRAHHVLVAYVMGFVSSEVTDPMQNPKLSKAEMVMRVNNLSPDRFPYLFEALPYLMGSDTEAAFDYGIDLILGGIRARVATPAPPIA
jgi:AcrR family transcriptional regulator